MGEEEAVYDVMLEFTDKVIVTEERGDNLALVIQSVLQESVNWNDISYVEAFEIEHRFGHFIN